MKRPFYHSRVFQLLVGGSVTAGCLGIAWWQISQESGDESAWVKIQQAFQTANYAWLPLMWLSLVAFFALKAWRWSLLLRPIKPCTAWQATPAMMIGFAFNNLLPAHLGDLARVFVFARSKQASTTGVLSTVALERVLDVLAIFSLLVLGLSLVEMPSNQIRNIAFGAAGIASIGVVCALIYLFWTKPFVSFVEGILARMKFLPSGFSKKVAGLMEAGAAGLASLKDPRLVVGLIFSSLAQWVLNALLVYLALLSFGLKLPLAVSFVVMGTVAFAVTIPSSPGYFGVIQLTFAMSAGLFLEADLRPAVYAASVYYHLVQWGPVTLIGLIFLNRSGFSITAVDEEAAHLAEDVGPVEPGETGEQPAGNPA